MAAESLPGITDHRVEIDVLDGLTVRPVFPVHATATGGWSHVDPVGRSIAGSAKTMGVYQGFQQQGTVSIVTLPVLRHAPGTQGQNFAGQSFDPHPGQNQESAVVHDPLQVTLPLLVTPADP